MKPAADIAVAFVALYPVVSAAIWVAGGLLFRLVEERAISDPPVGRWPGVTVVVSAYNEEQVIAACVTAVLEADYPNLELLVLDDGSIDGTKDAALTAAAADPRCRVVRDPVNRGKAEQLNRGFALARHELVLVTDADTHVHPLAVRLLVRRLLGSPMLAAVAGAPHVTNRSGLICAMQVLEAASIIGLIRRAQAFTGRVGTVAGVLALFRRDRVLEVGGYDGRMATEDIDLTWRLLFAGWHTGYEPRALVGMQVPSTLRDLWAQRKRWARGQGEVLHARLADAGRWRFRRMWLVTMGSLASLLWVVALALSLVLAALQLISGGSIGALGYGLAWGIAVAVVGTVQIAVALQIDFEQDPRGLRAFLVGPLYPMAYWTITAAAALRSQTAALVRGPRERHVVWDIPRERLAARPRG